MGCTHSGLVPDFKVIVKQTRKEFQTYKLKIHGWTQSGGVRPFGCCVLIAGYDRDGHHLFQIDPFGGYYELKAGALEKNRQKATQNLERRYKDGLSIDNGLGIIISTLREEYDGEITEKNIEIAII